MVTLKDNMLFCSCGMMEWTGIPCSHTMHIYLDIHPEQSGVYHTDISVVWWKILPQTYAARSNLVKSNLLSEYRLEPILVVGLICEVIVTRFHTVRQRECVVPLTHINVVAALLSQRGRPCRSV